MSQYPLKGVRIIDFSAVWVGPAISQLLADMGAEVIRIESRRHIDLVRTYTTRVKGKPADYNIDHNVEVPIQFENYNRNKLGITLDLGNEEARNLVIRLVSLADVVLENFPPRVMSNWGLTYEELRKVQPGIIMLSVTAAGQWGPLRDIVTYGTALGGLTGMETLVGYKDDRPLGSQRDQLDPLGAVFGAFILLAALRYRNRTGKGQHIDLSQWEAGVTTMGYSMMDWILNKRNAGRIGNKHRWSAPHGCYRCQGDDKWVSIAVTNEREWQGLCQALGNPKWAQDKRFKDMHNRKQNEDELDHCIEECTSKLDQYDVMYRLQRNGVAAAPSLDTIDIANGPHYKARDVWARPITDENQIIAGVQWKLSRSTGGIYRAAPPLGRDRDYVFCELLGMTRAEIAMLDQQGIFY
ncbi:CaiB/BaiF CoA transferase family protein [Chloroflexota bacterium]